MAELIRRDFLKTAGLLVMGLFGGSTGRAAEVVKAKSKISASKATEKIEVKSTLENLNFAFNGESNANARYLAFAAKADQEGYGKVASLFRAAAKAEEIHAANHAKVIKQLGGTPKADIQKPEAKSTKENLEAAIKGETYEFKVMYPAFLKKAQTEGTAPAVRTFNYANKAEQGHAKLYTEALANLETWKGPGVEFFVCKTCGNTVTKLSFSKCPVCFHGKDEYIAVK